MDSFFPKLIVSDAIVKQNITKMAAKARRNDVVFRPHFKTHQSQTIGNWFKKEGVSAISVSSVKMAKYFMEDSWDDIFIAFPVNVLEAKLLNEIARKIKLSVSIESVEVADHMEKYTSHPMQVYLKIDCGYHRTGLDPKAHDEIDEILQLLKGSDHLFFKGFYTHAGHTYGAKNTKEIIKIHESSTQQLISLKQQFLNEFPDLIVSAGDTPSCSTVEDFQMLDEIRPGNFVFYDLMQAFPGICTLEEIALIMECPVVAKHKVRNEIIIHGGAVHLSKEFIIGNGQKHFGMIVDLKTGAWNKPLANTYVKNLSQEHGIIKTDEKNFDNFNVGDTVGVIPVHSCLTANLAKCYYNLDGMRIEKMRS